MGKTTKWLLVAALIAAVTAVALADLRPWKDYTPSEAVWVVTTVKVDANMGDAYLEGLRRTWVPGNKISKELGHIEDFKIMRSDLPQSGEFNLLLMVKYKNSSMAAPNEARNKAFLEKWGEANADAATEHAQKNYPAMRTLTGSYMMREISMK